MLTTFVPCVKLMTMRLRACLCVLFSLEQRILLDVYFLTIHFQSGKQFRTNDSTGIIYMFCCLCVRSASITLNQSFVSCSDSKKVKEKHPQAYTWNSYAFVMKSPSNLKRIRHTEKSNQQCWFNVVGFFSLFSFFLSHMLFSRQSSRCLLVFWFGFIVVELFFFCCVSWIAVYKGHCCHLAWCVVYFFFFIFHWLFPCLLLHSVTCPIIKRTKWRSKCAARCVVSVYVCMLQPYQLILHFML